MQEGYYRLAAVLVLLLFYAVYFGKMLAQRRKGIRTDQIGYLRVQRRDVHPPAPDRPPLPADAGRLCPRTGADVAGGGGAGAGAVPCGHCRAMKKERTPCMNTLLSCARS